MKLKKQKIGYWVSIVLLDIGIILAGAERMGKPRILAASAA